MTKVCILIVEHWTSPKVLSINACQNKNWLNPKHVLMDKFPFLKKLLSFSQDFPAISEVKVYNILQPLNHYYVKSSWNTWHQPKHCILTNKNTKLHLHALIPPPIWVPFKVHVRLQKWTIYDHVRSRQIVQVGIRTLKRRSCFTEGTWVEFSQRANG